MPAKRHTDVCRVSNRADILLIHTARRPNSLPPVARPPLHPPPGEQDHVCCARRPLLATPACPPARRRPPGPARPGMRHASDIDPSALHAVLLAPGTRPPALRCRQAVCPCQCNAASTARFAAPALEQPCRSLVRASPPSHGTRIRVPAHPDHAAEPSRATRAVLPVPA